VIILGIDPSLRSTGYGVILVEKSRCRALEFGTIPNKNTLSLSQCLVRIHEVIADKIAVHQPQAAAIEGIIYLQNHQTAIILGAARGAALLALAQASVPTFEYAPRLAKSAATGHGGAKKEQVAFMMRATLGLTVTPEPDAADALALAMAHAQNKLGLAKAKKL
jgi:crossover junction endodeoxyribonuclease RuvC